MRIRSRFNYINVAGNSVSCSKLTFTVRYLCNVHTVHCVRGWELNKLTCVIFCLTCQRYRGIFLWEGEGNIVLGLAIRGLLQCALGNCSNPPTPAITSPPPPPCNYFNPFNPRIYSNAPTKLNSGDYLCLLDPDPYSPCRSGSKSSPIMRIPADPNPYERA